MSSYSRDLPRPARRFLSLVLPRHWRDDVLADLAERYSRRRGHLRRLWLLREITAYPLLLLRERLRPAALPHRNRRENYMESLVRDLRYALRGLVRNPVFAGAVLLTLTLGIGANSAVFSVFDAVLLRALPVGNPDRLVTIQPTTQDGPSSFSYPIFHEMEQEQEIFAGMFAAAGSSLVRASLDGRRLGRVTAESVSGEYFGVLRVRARLGRLLTTDDDRLPAEAPEPAAVISFPFWQRQFGGDHSVVGRIINVDDRDYSIVGVAPRGFFGAAPGSRPDLWLPMRQSLSEDTLNWRTGTFFRSMARLQDGRSLEDTKALASSLYRQLISEEADRGLEGSIREERQASDYRIELTSGAGGFSQLRQAYSEPLWILLQVVGLVLLITCFNVATLLLSRTAARRHELGTRLALGSNRGRLARQLMTESLLLAGLGALGGIGVAYCSLGWLTSLLTWGSRSVELDVALNLRVLGYALAVSMLTGALFGLGPALRGTSDGPHLLLGGRDSTAGRPRQRLTRVLVVGQLALSVVLLSTTGILLRSLQQMASLDVGFERHHLVVADVSLASRPAEQRAQFARQLEERLSSLPGVEAAGAAWMNVFGRSNIRGSIKLPGVDLGEDDILVRVNVVTPGHLAALGVPLLTGRSLSWSDGAESEPVALVNAAFVERYLQGVEPIGQPLQLSGDDPRRRIVGVVGDFLWNNLRAPREPIFLLPAAQLPSAQLGALQLRTAPGLEGIEATLRRTLQELDPQVLVTRVQTIESRIDATIAQEHLVARLGALFALLGTFLAGVGLYGVLSYSTVRRRREFGIRMAVGGRRSQMVAMVLRETLGLVALAAALGIPAALFFSRLLEGLLFQVEPADPISLAVVGALLAALALVAGYLPARRASSLNPVETLRAE